MLDIGVIHAAVYHNGTTMRPPTANSDKNLRPRRRDPNSLYGYSYNPDTPFRLSGLPSHALVAAALWRKGLGAGRGGTPREGVNGA